MGQLGTVIVGALGLLFVVMVWSGEGALHGLTAASIALALCFFTWWIWTWPKVVIEDRGITVNNQLRSYQVGWDVLKGAESRYGLYLVTEPDSPDGGQKQIYCAGVPMRGGFSASRQKEAPLVPALYFENGPNLTMRVEPPVAVQLIEEELLLQNHPRRREPTHQATPAQVQNWKTRGILKKFVYGGSPNESADSVQFKGLTSTVNWLVLVGLVGTALLALVLGLNY